ncbi:MAG: signal peptidase I [Dehalococcoidia bacterium]
MIRQIIQTVVLAFVLFFVVQMVFQNFRVQGESMEPSVSSGQWLITNKAVYFFIDYDRIDRFLPFVDLDGGAYLFHAPKRGEVVVFDSPVEPGAQFIKRVIAIPGDEIEVRSGKVILNGQVLEEPYVKQQAVFSCRPEVLDEDEYYVLGDNRGNSRDSCEFGPIHVSAIIGKAWVSYWPLDDWGLVPNTSISTPSKGE